MTMEDVVVTGVDPLREQGRVALELTKMEVTP